MTTALMTAEELERVSIPGKVTELIRGRLVVREPPGSWHGALSARMGARLTVFVDDRGLGLVFAQDTGFKIESGPDTVRAPDVAFVATTRLDAVKDRGYAALAPDLLAEVLSHDDRPGEVLAKVAQWLEAGTRLIWVIDPERRVARVYRADGSMTVLREGDALDGEDVLPGFSYGLKDLFKSPLSRMGEGDRG